MITAKEMEQSVIRPKSTEFERTMASIEKRKGFPSGYYYRTGKLAKDTIEKLESLGFKVVITCYLRYGMADHYSSYVCWTEDAVSYNTPDNSSFSNMLGYCTNNPNYKYEDIPERYNRRICYRR